MAVTGGYTKVGFQEKALPAISGGGLQTVETGVAQGAHLTGLESDRTAALATASPFALMFCTDSGVLYQSLGANGWQRVAPGGQTINLNGVASYTIANLSGDTDQAYEILLAGTWANAAAARWITVRPNGITANCTTQEFDSYSNPGVASEQGRTATSGLGLTPAWSAAATTQVQAQAVFRAKSGIRRTMLSQLLAFDVSTINMLAGFAGAVWNDTTTVVNSLTLDFGGVNFTGTLRVSALGS